MSFAVYNISNEHVYIIVYFIPWNRTNLWFSLSNWFPKEVIAIECTSQFVLLVCVFNLWPPKLFSCQSLKSISGYVFLSVSPLSVTHSHFLPGHLGMATTESDPEGVSTDSLWFALSVPSVPLSAEALLFFMNSMCRVLLACSLWINSSEIHSVFPVMFRYSFNCKWLYLLTWWNCFHSRPWLCSKKQLLKQDLVKLLETFRVDWTNVLSIFCV